METTYGARTREKHEPSIERLVEVIEKTTKRGGTVLIPSFAVGRTQELIYDFNELYERGETALLRNLKVYVDSPMATAATEAFRKNTQDFDAVYKKLVMSGDDPLDFKNLIFTRSTEESKALNADMTPKIIISASGMCEAGRILHHLKHRLWDPKSTIVVVGFQAEGTLGRRLIDGAKTVSVLSEAIDVRAEIVSLEGFSAHADRDGLLDWARGFDTPPSALFLVHGEADAKAAFKETLRTEAGLDSIVIEEYCSWTYEPGGKLSEDEQTSAGGAGVAAGAGSAVGDASSPAGKPIDPEDMERLLLKLRTINDNVEGLLYKAKLATVEAANDGDEKSYTALKNIIASLESDTSKLAGELTERREEN
jgi:metallo-beta-lactamase family protein